LVKRAELLLVHHRERALTLATLGDGHVADHERNAHLVDHRTSSASSGSGGFAPKRRAITIATTAERMKPPPTHAAIVPMAKKPCAVSRSRRPLTSSIPRPAAATITPIWIDHSTRVSGVAGRAASTCSGIGADSRNFDPAGVLMYASSSSVEPKRSRILLCTSACV